MKSHEAGGADAVEPGEQVEVLMEKLRNIERRSAAQEEILISMKQALEMKEGKLKIREVVMMVARAEKSKMRFLA